MNFVFTTFISISKTKKGRVARRFQDLCKVPVGRRFAAALLPRLYCVRLVQGQLQMKQGVQLIPLPPICELSNSDAYPASKISQDIEKQDQGSVMISSRRSSLSDTFVSLNKTIPHLETHKRHPRYQRTQNSEEPKSTNSDQTIPVHQRDLYPHHDKSSQKSLRKYASSIAIDIPPYLIAAIWAAAIFLSLRSLLL